MSRYNKQSSHMKRGELNKELKNEIMRTGDNSIAESKRMQSLDFHMRLVSLPMIDHRKPEEVRQRSMDYFEMCRDSGMMPTKPGYALALGITLPTLNAWFKQKNPNLPEDTYKVLAASYAVLNAVLEDETLHNGVNVAGGIFTLKNHYGYRDQVQFEMNVSEGQKQDNELQDLINEAKLLAASSRPKE